MCFHLITRSHGAVIDLLSHVIPFAMCRFIRFVAFGCCCSVCLSQHFIDRKHFCTHNWRHIASPFRLTISSSLSARARARSLSLDLSPGINGKETDYGTRNVKFSSPTFHLYENWERLLRLTCYIWRIRNGSEWKWNRSSASQRWKTTQTYFYDRRLGYFFDLVFFLSLLFSLSFVCCLRTLFLYTWKMPVAAFPITWNHFKCLIWTIFNLILLAFQHFLLITNIQRRVTGGERKRYSEPCHRLFYRFNHSDSLSHGIIINKRALAFSCPTSSPFLART